VNRKWEEKCREKKMEKKKGTKGLNSKNKEGSDGGRE